MDDFVCVAALSGFCRAGVSVNPFRDTVDVEKEYRVARPFVSSLTVGYF